MKDPIPQTLVAGVVYKFVCASCNAGYVGKTIRHLSSRVKEHLGRDTSSHTYKHINESINCKTSNNQDSFSILDRANNKI